MFYQFMVMIMAWLEGVAVVEVCLADQYDKRNLSVLVDRQFNQGKSEDIASG